jgi:hypothetical protein
LLDFFFLRYQILKGNAQKSLLWARLKAWKFEAVRGVLFNSVPSGNSEASLSDKLQLRSRQMGSSRKIPTTKKKF